MQGSLSFVNRWRPPGRAVSAARTEPGDYLLDSVRYQLLQPNALEEPAGRDRQQPLAHGGGDQREAGGVAVDHRSLRLPFRDCGGSDSVGALARIQQLCRGTRPVFGGEHQRIELCVAAAEAHIGPAKLQHALIEVELPPSDCPRERGFETAIPGSRDCVQQRLFAGKVAARRSVADTQLPAERAQRELIDATPPEGELART